MRVIGSQGRRTRFGFSTSIRPRHFLSHSPLSPGAGARGKGVRPSGSLFIDARVKFRRARTVRPYVLTAVVESLAPGGSSMKGMHLSGKPGMVQPMETPPTLGQP